MMLLPLATMFHGSWTFVCASEAEVQYIEIIVLLTDRIVKLYCVQLFTACFSPGRGFPCVMVEGIPPSLFG